MERTKRVHDEVRIERAADDGVARLVMERGDAPVNVFTSPKVEAMTEAVEELSGEADCLVLHGSPEFSAGADLRSIEDAPTEMRSVKINTIAAASNRFIRALRRFPAPVIAAVAGVAAGGGLGFALASDLIAVHRDAILDTAYARIGLSPDNATPFFLARTVGPYRARELFFDPEPITAADAVDLGIANRRIDEPEEAFLDAVMEWATTLAAGPTGVHEQTKRLIDSTFEGRLNEHLEEEREAIRNVSASDAFDVKLEAFLDEGESD